MRAAIVQNAPAFGEREGNARSLVRLMENAVRGPADQGRGIDLFVLPELCCSGYLFLGKAEALSLAEDASGGPSLDILERAARDLDAALAFGFPERSGGSLFNSQMLLLPDGSRSVYRKTHLFDAEKGIFEPGDTGFLVRQFRGLRIGMAICFDWIFPEAFRSLALLGADLVAHSANLVLPWCQRAGFVRALENRVYLATANRSGSDERGEKRLSFSGASIAYDPSGEPIASLPTAGEASASFDVDPALSRDKRLGGNDLFRDRRPELYFLD